MKKKIFIISLIVVLIISSVSICFASSDIPVWAEVSRNSISD